MSVVDQPGELKALVKRGTTKLPTIQVLRGVAAAMVVFYHFTTVLQLYNPNPSWITNTGLGAVGACGVDIFFVISGFIMVYTTTRREGGSDAVDFLHKRALRIYPLYWIWSTVILLAYLAHLGMKKEHLTLGYIVQSYLLIPAWNGTTMQPMLSQGWTLSFEMLFYLVFSVGIWIGFKRWRMPFLLVAFGALFGVSRAFPEGSGMRYLLSDPLIFEFLFGVGVAEIILRLPEERNARWIKVLPMALVVIGVAGLLATMTYHYPADLRFATCGLPAFCIVLGGAMMGSAPRPAWLVYLGDASYSIYLTHAFLSIGIGAVMKRVPALDHGNPDIWIIGAGVFTIAVSSLSYPLVERRLTAALSPKKPSARPMAATQGKASRTAVS